jgi:hypothetical protein
MYVASNNKMYRVVLKYQMTKYKTKKKWKKQKKKKKKIENKCISWIQDRITRLP